MLTFVLALPSICHADEPEIRFEQRDGELRIQVGDTEITKYVYRDPKISRPYFAPLRTLGDLQVTRNHPPREGDDPVDHADMHPGLWMSFGDLNGHDYWRLKATTQHVRFTEDHPESTVTDRLPFRISIARRTAGTRSVRNRVGMLFASFRRDT